MAGTTRNVVNVVASWGTTSTKSISKYYHPDFAFQKYNLNWNDGATSGGVTNSCINASGNREFNNGAFLSNAVDWYIGTGTPTDAESSTAAGTTASALVGVGIGLVGTSNRGNAANVSTVATGSSFTEYDKSASVNNSNYGSVTFAGNTGSSVSFKLDYGLQSSAVLPTTGYLRNGSSGSYSIKNNSTFIGWWKNGVKSNSSVYTETESLVAVFGLKFTLVFDKNLNDGTATTSNTYYYGCSDYQAQGNIPANTWTRNRYAFAGWNTEADGSGTSVADEADAESLFTTLNLSANGSKTLYAQWTYTAFNVTISKSYVGGVVGVAQEDIGTLTLVDANNTTVATENATTHILTYEGTANPSGSTSPQYTYRVVCTMDDGKPDLLWAATGITDGGRIASNVITPYEGDTLTASFVFTKKSLYTFTLDYSPSGKQGTVGITSPSEADESGKYIAGRDIVVSGTPLTGYKLDHAQGTSGRSFTGISNNSLTYENIASDETLTLYFTKETYTATVAKDADSASAISSVKIKLQDAQEWSATGVEEYDVEDTLTLQATVATGYAFDGWYVDGTRVSTSATYSYSGNGTKTFVAKAKVSVSLAVVTRVTSGALPTPSVSPDLNITGVTDGYVTLGSSFSYEIVLRDWLFNAWFVTGTQPPATGGVPLAYGSSGTIKPNAALDITADVTSNIIVNTITVVMEDDEIPAGSSTYTDISQSGIISTVPTSDSGGWVEPTGSETRGHYAFVFNGTKEVTLKSLETIDDSDPSTTDYAFVRFADNDHNTIGTNPEYSMLTSTKTIRAMYAKGGTRSVTLGYATAGGVTGDSTFGTFEFTGVTDSQLSNDGRTATVARGTTIGIVAKPKNGYKFMGWYSTQVVGGDPYNTGTDVSIVVSTNRDLYAYFAQDANAVYVWEGSGDNKSMEWKSKLFKAAKPFNPTCCRVDTEGYPLIEMDVEMFSAPDTSYTARTVLTNLASQTARRLPVRRPERFMQICVKNNAEVDAIYVGTNMRELAQ